MPESYPPTSDDDAIHQQREQNIRRALEEGNMIPVVEAQAARHGFRDPKAAVDYVIGNWARDSEAYQRAMNNAYEPEQFALFVDLALAQLERKIGKRVPSRPTDAPKR